MSNALTEYLNHNVIRKTRAEILANPPKRGQKAITTDTNECCSRDENENIVWECIGNQLPAGQAGSCCVSTGPDPRDLEWVKGATGVFPNGEGQTLTIKDGVVILIS